MTEKRIIKTSVLIGRRDDNMDLEFLCKINKDRTIILPSTLVAQNESIEKSLKRLAGESNIKNIDIGYSCHIFDYYSETAGEWVYDIFMFATLKDANQPLGTEYSWLKERTLRRQYAKRVEKYSLEAIKRGVLLLDCGRS